MHTTDVKTQKIEPDPNFFWRTKISDSVCRDLKGAVCRILTLLKHKNTIIYLQTFRKHVKLTYLFIWKIMLQSVILLWKCAVRPGMSVFVMVCETRPLPVYPIVLRHPGLPVAGKHSVFNLINCHVCSFLLVSLIWHPAHASNLRRRGWWKKPSPIFWIWTAIPSSTARLSILHTAPLIVFHLCKFRASIMQKAECPEYHPDSKQVIYVLISFFFFKIWIFLESVLLNIETKYLFVFILAIKKMFL